MSVKILLIFVCTAVGTACGYIVMRRYRRDYEYLNGMCSVINELKRNIAYRRDGAASVLGTCDVKSAQLKKNIEEYITFAGGKDDKPNISRGFLPNDIYTRVCDMFCSLGRGDGTTQIEVLNMYGDAFGKLTADAQTKCAKYGAVAVKLGFLFGLGLGVLIL